MSKNLLDLKFLVPFFPNKNSSYTILLEFLNIEIQKLLIKNEGELV